MNNPKVVMLGLGYIGLPTAAIIASKKLQVLGVDVQARVVDTINAGGVHIIEPDLDGLVKSVVSNGWLRAALKPEPADVFIVAVPTPFGEEKRPDISYVEAATRSVLPLLRPGNLFIIESTSPVGTTRKMAKIIFEARPELRERLRVAYCPERVLPGKVIYELEHNDRVIGGIDAASTQAATDFYSIFVRGGLHPTHDKTAEMCKLTENSFRDTNIAFANELSLICDKAGINVWELIELANKHPRVKILQPGTGVGGHCIAVDPWFIVSDFPAEAQLIRRARLINDFKPLWVVEKVKNAALAFALEHGRKPLVALLGLAFKPNIDDLRESPAVQVALGLMGGPEADYLVVEPNVEQWKHGALTPLDEATRRADMLVFLVAHRPFERLEQHAHELDFCGARKNR